MPPRIQAVGDQLEKNEPRRDARNEEGGRNDASPRAKRAAERYVRYLRKPRNEVEQLKHDSCGCDTKEKASKGSALQDLVRFAWGGNCKERVAQQARDDAGKCLKGPARKKARHRKRWNPFLELSVQIDEPELNDDQGAGADHRVGLRRKPIPAHEPKVLPLNSKVNSRSIPANLRSPIRFFYVVWVTSW